MFVEASLAKIVMFQFFVAISYYVLLASKSCFQLSTNVDHEMSVCRLQWLVKSC